ncbi:hypothetical protein Aduo_004833 [Ancylostoma duodenale]
MPSILTALFTVSLFTISSSKYVPLSIVTIRPNQLGRFGAKIEESIVGAIRNLSGIISVLDYGDRNITRAIIHQCSAKFMSATSVILSKTEEKRISEDIMKLNELFLLKTSSFVLLVENNKKLCKSHPKMLASASPCTIQDNKRPLLGVVNICPGMRWDDFYSGIDLFRHEILHSLGFGTLIPSTDSQKSPNNVLYEWTYPWSMTFGKQAKRRFLDFAREAVVEARRHLGCSSLVGIETDSAEKIHLNEYVYGNELMTPILSNVSNRFSYISAAILEETYFGAKPWYSVNRSAIRAEHDGLWYGRKWGCTFAERSCFEFITERIKDKKTTFPFCSQKDYESHEKTKVRIKVSPKKVLTTILKCWSAPLRKDDAADNGIMPYTLSRDPDSFLRHRTGSHPLLRYCPVVADIVKDRFELPVGAILV